MCVFNRAGKGGSLRVVRAMWYEHDGAHEGRGMEGAAEVDSQWAGARSAALLTVTLGSKVRSRHPTARNLLTQ